MKFSDEYAFLSNFYPSPISVNGVVYPDVETAYQAAKTVNALERTQILKSGTPAAAKKLGKKVTMRPDWEQVKVAYMYRFVKLKFQQNPDLAEKLLNTGNVELIEGNYWHDQFWGDCSCEKHCNEPGKNILGNILMLIREDLRTAKCI